MFHFIGGIYNFKIINIDECSLKLLMKLLVCFKLIKVL